METAQSKWQECLDYFEPATGQPPQDPDREEFLRLRKVAERIGMPCAVVLEGKAFGKAVPPDVLQGLAQIVENFEQRIAALHMKLPKSPLASTTECTQ